MKHRNQLAENKPENKVSSKVWYDVFAFFYGKIGGRFTYLKFKKAGRCCKRWEGVAAALFKRQLMQKHNSSTHFITKVSTTEPVPTKT